MRRLIYKFFLSFLLLTSITSCVTTHDSLVVKGDFHNLSREDLLEHFSKDNLRSYTFAGNEESMTFNDASGHDHRALTFYLKNNTVSHWQMDDREEMAKQYLNEFASGNIFQSYPKIANALLNVLQKMPYDAYLQITERSRPILFIDYYTGGIAKYAGSLEFTMRETDPPTFMNGFWIIRLGDGLNEANDIKSIEGVIAHEIAHRVLENLKNTNSHPCEREIDANALVKEWGFSEEFQKASDEFGAKNETDSPCQIWIKEQNQKKESPLPQKSEAISPDN